MPLHTLIKFLSACSELAIWLTCRKDEWCGGCGASSHAGENGESSTESVGGCAVLSRGAGTALIQVLIDDLSCSLCLFIYLFFYPMMTKCEDPMMTKCEDNQFFVIGILVNKLDLKTNQPLLSSTSCLCSPPPPPLPSALLVSSLLPLFSSPTSFPLSFFSPFLSFSPLLYAPLLASIVTDAV